MNAKKILNTITIILLIVNLFGCGKDNQRFKDEIKIGENAMLNNNYELAFQSFSNALIIKPNDLDATLLLDNAKSKLKEKIMDFMELKQKLTQYVLKINELQDLFVQTFNSKQKANDLYLLTLEADFSPPQQIYEIHKLYINFLKEWTRSADLYDQGNVEEATEVMGNTDGIFSDFNNKFGYFLEENNIDFIEIGYSGRFGYPIE